MFIKADDLNACPVYITPEEFENGGFKFLWRSVDTASAAYLLKVKSILLLCK